MRTRGEAERSSAIFPEDAVPATSARPAATLAATLLASEPLDGPRYRSGMPALFRACAALALRWTHRGSGALARAYLDRMMDVPLHDIERGYLTLLRAYTSFIDGEEAAPIGDDVRALFDEAPRSWRREVLIAALEAVTAADGGRLDDADAALARAVAAGRNSGDARAACQVRGARAVVLAAHGDRLGALGELRLVQRELERGRFVVGAQWAAGRLGALLFVLGRRREAQRVLNRAAAEALESRTATTLRAVDQARREDPLLAACSSAAETTTRDPLRRRTLAALRRAAADGSDEALALVEDALAATAAPGYELDGALCQLARAIVAERRGDGDGAAVALAAARRLACAGAVDDDVLPALADAFGLPWTVERADVVIDVRGHVLRAPRATIDLGKRVMLRKLLYALAASPGERLDKETLVGRAWGVRYHPAMHDNVLAVSVYRLRRLTAEAGIAIEHDGEGYKLTSGDGRVALI